MKKIILLSLTILSSLYLTACANTDSQPVPVSPTPTDTLAITENVTPTSNTITVNSSESVCVIPDIAQIVYSVRTEAKTAGDCQQQNATALNRNHICHDAAAHTCKTPLSDRQDLPQRSPQIGCVGGVHFLLR